MYDMNMTAEKAIAVLNNHKLNECDNQKLISAELEAIQALEKQIPKKPCRISEIDENDNALVECPICHAGNDYSINTIKSGYCWNCGQKLEW